MMEWINMLLSQRDIRLEADATKQALVVKGCPQGGGLFIPMVWWTTLTPLWTTITIIPVIVCDVTRSALAIVKHRSVDNELSINSSKTEMVMFTNKWNLRNYQLPRVFNAELQFFPEVKYLGVIFNHRLNWTAHLNYKIEKATLVLWQCCKMVVKT